MSNLEKTLETIQNDLETANLSARIDDGGIVVTNNATGKVEHLDYKINYPNG